MALAILLLDNIVNRKTFNPKAKTLHKIAAAFNITLAEFLDVEERNAFSFDDEEENKSERLKAILDQIEQLAAEAHKIVEG